MKKQLYITAVALLALLSSTSRTYAQCAAPVSIMPMSVTSTSAYFSWSADTSAMGFEYLVDMSSADPMTTGTMVMAPSATVTGLMPGMAYYMHVRSVCISGYSAWGAPAPFSTPSVTSCMPPTALTPTSISCDSEMVSWPAVSGAMAYECVVDNAASAPTTPGSYTMSPMFVAIGLSASTMYYAHVRTACDTSTFSTWQTASFTTAPCTSACAAPTGITATPAVHKAHLSWTPVSGAMGYEYVVNTTTANPTSAGTAITTDTITATGLSAATSYYVHTRTRCGASTYSPWSTSPSFSTAVATGVTATSTPGNAATMEVYPNPATDMIAIEINGTLTANPVLEIISIDGRVVEHSAVTGNTTEFDIKALQPGVYFIRYSDGVSNLNTRVIKQ